MFDIEEELKKLPDQPGVYIMHDARDAIIYVGKAVSLRKRVHQYFQPSHDEGAKKAQMVRQIAWFEYIVTDSELEALVLECNLIKEHSPKYNTMLRDDKTYPYIKVTLGEDFPRVLFSRRQKKDKSRYFGPYTSAGAVKETIELVNKACGLRTCSRVLPRDIGKDRPCLNYHIHLCDAPCMGAISKEEYKKRVDAALSFLGGEYGGVLKSLEEKMSEASENLAFEQAIAYRDQIESIKKIAQNQKVTQGAGEDKDVVALAADDRDAVVQVFFIRDGKLIGRDHFYIRVGAEDTRSQILGTFLKQFYAGTPYIPREIMLPEPADDQEVLAEWLKERRGARVTLSVPQRGKKEKLVELAQKNAELVLSQDREKIRREEGRTIGALREIASLLGLESLDRVEAFDISNTSGFASVGSMVVYEKGKPKRSDYRKFRLKTVSGPDDYASMYEVLCRRFEHGLRERGKPAGAAADSGAGIAADVGADAAGAYDSFTRFPDLIMMDGGRGQVNVALKALGEMGLSIPVCGMVKDDRHRTRGLYYHGEEVPIDRDSEGFKLITRIQDEAHRFAIEYHRSLRGKAQVHSVLDDIPGVGPARRKALMKKYQSLDAIKAASEEDLAETESMNAAAARQVYAYFRDRKPDTGDAPGAPR